MTDDGVAHRNVLKSNYLLVTGLVTINKTVYYQHLLVSFEELSSLRLIDPLALVVGWINKNWLNLWKRCVQGVQRHFGSLQFILLLFAKEKATASRAPCCAFGSKLIMYYSHTAVSLSPQVAAGEIFFQCQLLKGGGGGGGRLTGKIIEEGNCSTNVVVSFLTQRNSDRESFWCALSISGQLHKRPPKCTLFGPRTVRLNQS